VRSLADVAPSATVLADVSPGALASIARDRLPASFVTRARRFRHGPGVFKIDYTLDAPVPWTDPSCRRAGTVHVGGSVAEVAASERAMWRGEAHDRPFVLVAQPTLADPTRAPAGKHTLWTYCHVPAGSTVDMTDAIEAQLERFAPGFRDVVRGRHTMGPAEYEAYDQNDVGGDIAGGAHDGRQLLARGTGVRPYRTGVDSILLCSASTPPGAGVHGMCGVHAANVALRTTLR
jgi:phytoene dehydrogenase-like protein